MPSPVKSFDELTDAGRVRRLRRVAEAALRQYDARPTSVLPIREGECMTFRVQAQNEPGGAEQFVLRIHTPGYQTAATIHSELLWLVALGRAGLRVPEPVPNRAGEWVTVAVAPDVPDPRCCDLLRWQEGRGCRARMSEAAFRQVGRFLGHLHPQSERFVPPPGFTRQRWDGEHLFGRPVEEGLRAVEPHLSPAEFAVVQQVVARDRQARAILGQDRDVFGLIHADFHHGNFLFQRGEVHAIDFDDCGFGHYLYDLAVALSTSRGWPNYPALRAALLAGYRDVRPLAAQHEEQLPALMAARSLSLMVWRVIRWNRPHGLGRFLEDMEKILWSVNW
jgi:Ser/Thr protein kinase RdoA (MazF antagonist)